MVAIHVVDHHVLLAGVRADALDLGMVLVADDADRVAGLGQLAGGLLRLEDPGAGGVDHLELALLGPQLLHLGGGHAMGADDQGAALDLVGQVGGADAAIGEVGLDARVVDQLAECRHFLALLAGVLGLVDRQAHAIAEAGALGDADVGTG